MSDHSQSLERLADSAPHDARLASALDALVVEPARLGGTVLARAAREALSAARSGQDDCAGGSGAPAAGSAGDGLR